MQPKESVNETQIGGDHYKSEYQHWDLVCDLGLHYLLANASKYVTRWRKKNGAQDLEKAEHYIKKFLEKKLRVMDARSLSLNETQDLVKQFNTLNIEHNIDATIIFHICIGVRANLELALDYIHKLISQEQNPTGMEHPFGYDAELEKE
jgi:hypothetical protein